MTKLLLALAAALAAIGGVLAIVLVAGGGGDGARLAPPAGDPVLLASSVSPSRHLFGDRLVAEVRLTVDRTRVDPARIESAPVLRPFQQVGPVAVERVDLGDTTILAFRYPIQCLERSCVPGEDATVVSLGLGLVRYSPREGDVVTLPLDFPPLTVVTRLDPSTQRYIQTLPAALSAEAGLAGLPEVSLRGGSLLLGWLLLGGAGAIVLSLGLAVAVRAAPRLRQPATEPVAGRPPLESALELVGASLTADEPRRRIALDELRLRLLEAGDEERALEARELAWSAAGPVDERVRTLLGAIRGTGEAAP